MLKRLVIIFKWNLDKTNVPKLHFSVRSFWSNITLDTATVIKDLEPEKFYKYLAVTDGYGIHHSSMREKIRKQCFCRMRSILRSELNARNRIYSINSLALPVVTYSFTVNNWSLTEIKKVDTKIRNILTIYQMHHHKRDVNSK